jgi:regulation of enolase protein 1 (concanavalin A-like superfamily)
VAGSAREASGTWTLDGSGDNVWSTSDEFRYAYQPVTGDVDIRVRVASLENVDDWSKAGVMIRESLAANSRNAFMLVSPGSGRAFQRRSSTGGSTTRATTSAGTAPVWLRLVRQGSQFTGYLSADGTSWTTTGSATISMTSSVYVGLAVTSRVDSTLATATFTNVQVGTGSGTTGLPAPWTNRDIGSPALAGSATAAGGTFTVRGAGYDIWDDTDEFQFVSQPLTGDVEVIARVASFQYADPWSKAGVMIRDTLTGDSRHAFMLTSGTQGWAFQRRIATGGTSDHSAGPSGGAPGWVRLVREGNLFTAYRSSDGTTWSLVGTDTITMAPTVHVGLAVLSANVGATATATFTNVTARTATTGTNQPPTVSLTSPAAGATFTAPASVTISAAASDTDGTVTQVDFYRGTTLLASDTTNPYGYTWSNVAAGSYQLTAVATDSDGVAVTSSPVTVTVNAPANQPPAVSLTSPSAGASFIAPANITLQASASDADGTVARVEFYRGTTLVGSDTTSPYSAVWAGAAAGSYTLTAMAVDNGGSTRTSATTTISVTSATNQLPTVSITSPTAGQSFTAPASLTIAATASDPDGTIAGVDFYAGTQLVATDSTSPYTAAWTSVAAGSYSLTAVARDNAGGARTSSAVAVTVTGTAGLPAPWTNRDIGSPALAGSATAAGGTFTVRGAGYDIWDDTDEFQFVSQPLTGDVEVIARVASFQYAVPWSKAGVMIRDTLTEDSRHAFMLTSGTQGWAFQRRIATGGSSDHSAGPSGGAPGWVRLVREGNLFTAYSSSDGTTWSLVGTDTITMAPTVHVGLAVLSANVGATALATFTNVTARTVTTGTNQPPTVSITSPAAGATFTAPASVTISAAASDTDGTVTQVDFYRGTTLLASDTTSPYGYTWSNAAAGSYQLTAVARDNGGATTTSAAVSVTVNSPTNQAPAVSVTSPAPGASFTAPANVTLTASASDTDGTVARVEFYRGSTLIGSDTTSPYSAVWTGATAGSYSLTALAVDNGGATRTSTTVGITVTSAPNQLPTVSITSPIAGQSFTAPASLTMTAAASDSDGTIAGVDFYVGTQLIATDTTSPYSAAWTNVAAGSYSLTAVARDNAGGTRTSGAIAVTVTAAPPRPSTLVFGASVDHSTNVTSYIVALYRGVDPITASPVATRDLGKPTPVSGEISVNISTLVDPLPAGSYYAVVRASGPGGTTASAPSATFTK